jgi:hypothetical protein
MMIVIDRVELTELVQRAVRELDVGHGIHPTVHILANDQTRLDLPRKDLYIIDDPAFARPTKGRVPPAPKLE